MYTVIVTRPTTTDLEFTFLESQFRGIGADTNGPHLQCFKGALSRFAQISKPIWPALTSHNTRTDLNSRSATLILLPEITAAVISPIHINSARSSRTRQFFGIVPMRQWLA